MMDLWLGSQKRRDLLFQRVDWLLGDVLRRFYYKLLANNCYPPAYSLITRKLITKAEIVVAVAVNIANRNKQSRWMPVCD